MAVFDFLWGCKVLAKVSRWLCTNCKSLRSTPNLPPFLPFASRHLGSSLVTEHTEDNPCNQSCYQLYTDSKQADLRKCLCHALQCHRCLVICSVFYAWKQRSRRVLAPTRQGYKGRTGNGHMSSLWDYKQLVHLFIGLLLVFVIFHVRICERFAVVPWLSIKKKKKSNTYAIFTCWWHCVLKHVRFIEKRHSSDVRDPLVPNFIAIIITAAADYLSLAWISLYWAACDIGLTISCWADLFVQVRVQSVWDRHCCKLAAVFRHPYDQLILYLNYIMVNSTNFSLNLVFQYCHLVFIYMKHNALYI